MTKENLKTLNVMKKVISLFVVVLFAGLTSCQRDRVSGDAVINQRVTSLNQVVVPHDFDFETSQEYKFIFALGEMTPFQGKYLVQWYTDFPHAKAKARHSAFMDLNNPFVSDVTLPSNTRRVFVKLTSPSGSSFVQEMVVNNTTSHTFYTGKKANKTSTYVCPDCATGCDYTESNLNGDLELSKDYKNDTPGVICITGATGTGQDIIMNKDGWTIRVCTDLDLSKLRLTKDVTLIITSGNTVNVTDDFEMTNSGADIIVCSGATLNIDNNNDCVTSGTFTNYGTFDVDVNTKKIDFQADLINEGSMTWISGTDTYFKGDVTNNNSIEVTNGSGQETKLFQGEVFTNNCSFVVNGKFNVDGNFKNYSYVDINDLTYVNAKDQTAGQENARVYMYNGAQWESDSMHIAYSSTTNYGIIEGFGTTSLVKVSGDTRSPNGLVTGAIELCVSGTNTITNLTNGASLSCAVYIPTDACNTVGNGSPPAADSDGDGASDNVDEYPNDATRAYNVYSPSQGSYKTFAVEDLFPYKGDFDFNDLVVDYNIQSVTNADNEIVEQFVTVVTKAMGGSEDKGFGFNLSNLVPGDVSSVTGASNYPQSGDGDLNVSLGSNGTENSQASAVIIAYNSVNDHWADAAEGSFQNVRSADAYQDPDTSVLTITYTTPYDGTINVEPFAFVGARSKEIHAKNTEPTDLMDDTYFGTADDDSDGSSTFYTTANGLPWAIVIEDGMETVEEKSDITTAYLKFASWASSGGTTDTDWNTGSGSAYRDGNNIYTK